MRWSFTLHGGAAAVLSAAALALGGLTWLPGRGVLPLFEPAWPMVVVIIPAFLAALVRQFATGADRSAQWQAFRCLPGRVQAGLGLLAATSVAVMAMGVVAGAGERLQDAEVSEGRYVAYDTSVTTDRAVELTRDEYLALLPSSRRMMFAVPGLLGAAAAAIVLAAGELRRADDAR